MTEATIIMILNLTYGQLTKQYMEMSSSSLLEWLHALIIELRGSLKVDCETLWTKIISGLPQDLPKPETCLAFASETAASLTTRHPDYAILAGRLSVRKLYQTVPKEFSKVIDQSYHAGIVSREIWEFVQDHATELDEAIDHSCDDDWTFFGVETLTRSYLLRVHGEVCERPQHLFMRVAVGIHSPDMTRALETYKLMSHRIFTHATPTLFNAGTVRPQMASCFLVAMKEDSVEGIFDTLKLCAQISKHAGGIGMHISNVRASNCPIGPLGGKAAGIVPMLRVFNNAARFVDQGGNRRPGAISVTLEPWHADILAFLNLKKNHGKEEYRARDLFYALWVPDLFMKCVRNNEEWYLFSSDRAPGLQDALGSDFEELYSLYVSEKRWVSHLPAQKLWVAILDAQIETGNPSILYKDACNAKSNQQRLGTIKSSNLCTEIVQYSSPEEVAVCNLASIALPQFVTEAGAVDYNELHRVTKIIVHNLDIIIDRNYYPLEEAERSNFRHRPIAVGVQGLAEVYFKLDIPFDSVEAAAVNERIFATIYHAALEKSAENAREKGPYESFDGSPAWKGQLQFDLWNMNSQGKAPPHVPPADLPWDWQELKHQIRSHGLRNSLLTGVMPTASTSQLLGYSESIEPLTSNIYSRRTISGEFQVVNAYLVEKLEELGQWTSDTRERIMASNGSIQALNVPQHLKNVYKTVWEISQRAVIDQSADRGPYIDQSQSLNIFLPRPTRKQLTSMHFYGWSRGLKTGLYYLRTLPAATPIPFTLNHEIVLESRTPTPEQSRKRMRSDECEVCSA